ncbi:MAG: translation initiation factor IF-2 [Dehalococcoidia bacterium]|jgi:translation initiation factor IF-2|nr:translation initiation factor IF-2 [Chloroflexota bacterium]MDP6056774.1 translation initiation factor IF-2 [Dehalococcoidia bacterium]MDP7090209.1 translation initiation factor IF-2 [Dehalococcoidia bacterium]MDP7261871.1 translation initiation factor IF-2 [Dehalococcoidia bacterium]MDP7485926.1 translation initiation factor IF-2 [Dehalococcoidia bacterium]|tara:strand:- start:825 stop:2696 length:1872 start_codon:yes stop_codon:yes gene_type:complete
MARRREQGNYRGRSSRRNRSNDKPGGPDGAKVVVEDKTQRSPVELPAKATVGELAEILELTNVDTIKTLMRLGVMATVNETVEFGIAAKVAASFEIGVLKPKDREESAAAIKVGVDDDMTDDNSVTRPPVITVLGHVDHGKTTLLDAIRGAKMVETEAGGITQSIGAYQVVKDDQHLTFIDTPGHAAFTQMRASGAQVTDIAVLVVAADDGVMPQTLEAIDHTKAAGVPIIVAINKIDAPGADIDRSNAQLAEHEIIVESYGGDTVAVPVSALKGEGIDDLLESLLLVAEIQELKANPYRPGIGVVIESRMDRSRGAVASVLVRSGTVRTGDNVVAGMFRGRIKSMVDGFGEVVTEAGPSTPIEVLGLNGIPAAGDQFDVVANDREARDLVTTRERLASKRKSTRAATTMAEVMRRVQQSGAKELLIVIKTGSHGSIDAVQRAVEAVSNDEVQVRVLSAASGAINEADILLASASDAMVMGFETSVEAGARRQADAEGIAIRTYDIIYNLIDEVEDAARGLLEPERKQIVTGHANVLEVFQHGKREQIAGLRVTDGVLKRSGRMRVIRGGDEIFDGAITSMRHLKDSVRELTNNFEGGVMIDGFHEYQEGDVLEAYEIQVTRR